MRIVCLLPSATEICIQLGLKEYIVGITHECHWHNDDNTTNDKNDKPFVITSDGILEQQLLLLQQQKKENGDEQQQQQNDINVDPSTIVISQQDIHNFVINAAKKTATATATSANNDNNNNDNIVPSLYPINRHVLFEYCRPTIILTQDLCSVCAPTVSNVKSMIYEYNTSKNQKEQEQDESVTNDTSNGKTKSTTTTIQVVSLSPNNIQDIIQTFVQIGTACSVPLHISQTLCTKFTNSLQLIQNTIIDYMTNYATNNNNNNNTIICSNNNNNNTNEMDNDTNTHYYRRMLLLEWLQPPFTAGHWIPELMQYACIQPVSVNNTNTTKSVAVSWDDIKHSIDNNSNRNKNATTSTTATTNSTTTNNDDNNDNDNNDVVVVVSCCGFQLERNITDAISTKEIFQQYCTVSYTKNIIYAINADKYIVNPTPNLVIGCLLLAIIAYNDIHPKLVSTLLQLPILSNYTFNLDNEWKRIDFTTTTATTTTTTTNTGVTTNGTCCNHDTKNSTNMIGDIEDIGTLQQQQQQQQQQDSEKYDEIDDDSNNNEQQKLVTEWELRHTNACINNLDTYIDPQTEYTVFTEIAHKKRGVCCGSGCRHCPYNHMNVSNELRTTKIQQPCFLHTRQECCNTATATTTTTTASSNINNEQQNNDAKNNGSLLRNGTKENSNTVLVLFFSGGKDSFLALRAIIRSIVEANNSNSEQQQQQQQIQNIVLLTTYDATTKMIAHQNILIDTVVQQARHLQIPLVGVPLHYNCSIRTRTTGKSSSDEYYCSRIRRGLQCIEKEYGINTIQSLVFGDLHLSDIVQWRTKNLNDLLSSTTIPVHTTKTTNNNNNNTNDTTSTTSSLVQQQQSLTKISQYNLLYPILHVPYDLLVKDLEVSQVPITISSCNLPNCKEWIHTGCSYDSQLRQKIQSYNNSSTSIDSNRHVPIDVFGENSEFHTLANVWEVSRCIALGL